MPHSQGQATQWTVTKGESGNFELVEASPDDLKDGWSDASVYGLHPSKVSALQAYIDDMKTARRDAQTGIAAARRLLRRELKKEGS